MREGTEQQAAQGQQGREAAAVPAQQPEEHEEEEDREVAALNMPLPPQMSSAAAAVAAAMPARATATLALPIGGPDPQATARAVVAATTGAALADALLPSLGEAPFPSVAAVAGAAAAGESTAATGQDAASGEQPFSLPSRPSPSPPLPPRLPGISEQGEEEQAAGTGRGQRPRRGGVSAGAASPAEDQQPLPQQQPEQTAGRKRGRLPSSSLEGGLPHKQLTVQISPASVGGGGERPPLPSSSSSTPRGGRGGFGGGGLKAPSPSIITTRAGAAAAAPGVTTRGGSSTSPRPSSSVPFLGRFSSSALGGSGGSGASSPRSGGGRGRGGGGGQGQSGLHKRAGSGGKGGGGGRGGRGGGGGGKQQQQQQQQQPNAKASSSPAPQEEGEESTAASTASTGGGPVTWRLEEESPHCSPASVLGEADLHRHLIALRTESFARAVRPLLTRLMGHPANKGIFNAPVDAAALGLHDYERIVPHPMDLGTVKSRLQALQYQDTAAFSRDVRLVFDNARRFNPKGHWVHEAAALLLDEFEREYERLVSKAERHVQRAQEHRCEHCQQGATCPLCGEKCIRLEPPVLMCQGHCVQRIKRGGVYFISRDGARVFCQRCHSSLPSSLANYVADDESDPNGSSGDKGDDDSLASVHGRGGGGGGAAGMRMLSQEDEEEEDSHGRKEEEDAEEMEEDLEEEEEGRSFAPSASESTKLLLLASSTTATAGGAGAGEKPQAPPLLKRDLLRRKFDDEVVEPWVKCGGCRRWMHQVCALYNAQSPLLLLPSPPPAAPKPSTAPTPSPRTRHQLAVASAVSASVEVAAEGGEGDGVKKSTTRFFCPQCKLAGLAGQGAVRALQASLSVSSLGSEASRKTAHPQPLHSHNTRRRDGAGDDVGASAAVDGTTGGRKRPQRKAAPPQLLDPSPSPLPSLLPGFREITPKEEETAAALPPPPPPAVALALPSPVAVPSAQTAHNGAPPGAVAGWYPLSPPLPPALSLAWSSNGKRGGGPSPVPPMAMPPPMSLGGEGEALKEEKVGDSVAAVAVASEKEEGEEGGKGEEKATAAAAEPMAVVEDDTPPLLLLEPPAVLSPVGGDGEGMVVDAAAVAPAAAAVVGEEKEEGSGAGNGEKGQEASDAAAAGNGKEEKEEEEGEEERRRKEEQAAHAAEARRFWSAESLPETHMSRFMQALVRARLAALPETASGADAAESVTVRVVSSVPRSFDVHKSVRACFGLPSQSGGEQAGVEPASSPRGGEGQETTMKGLLEDDDVRSTVTTHVHGQQEEGDGGLEMGPMPKQVRYRSKAVLLFQRIDGCDLCLFSMYVQEYGRNAPSVNARRVYIAYLDSVEYFRPRLARTKVYHELLSAYLLWARLRGFQRAHIWACPPQRGNGGFIFWCHPLHQKTPSRERLLDWYQAMIERAQEMGAVARVTDLYHDCFLPLRRLLPTAPSPLPLPLPTPTLAVAPTPLPTPVSTGGGKASQTTASRPALAFAFPPSASSSSSAAAAAAATARQQRREREREKRERDRERRRMRERQRAAARKAAATGVGLVVGAMGGGIGGLQQTVNVVVAGGGLGEGGGGGGEMGAAVSSVGAGEQELRSYRPLPCPPLFDGDFWPEEMGRLAHALRRRAQAQLTGGKQCAASSAGPARGGKGGAGSGGSKSKGGKKGGGGGGALGPVSAQAYFFGTTPWHLAMSLLKAAPFAAPVDPVLDHAPNYFTIVKRPMDLSTAMKKLRGGDYPTLHELREDVELVFGNARLYNPPHHAVHLSAITLLGVFRQELAGIVAKCLGRPPPPPATRSSTPPPPPAPAPTTISASTGAGGRSPPSPAAAAAAAQQLAAALPSQEDATLLAAIPMGEALETLAATVGPRFSPSKKGGESSPSAGGGGKGAQAVQQQEKKGGGAAATAAKEGASAAVALGAGGKEKEGAGATTKPPAPPPQQQQQEEGEQAAVGGRGRKRRASSLSSTASAAAASEGGEEEGDGNKKAPAPSPTPSCRDRLVSYSSSSSSSSVASHEQPQQQPQQPAAATAAQQQAQQQQQAAQQRRQAEVMAGLLGQGVSPVQLVGDALRSVERMRADLLVLYLQPESEEEEEDRVVKMEEEEGAGAVELAPSVRRALGRLPTSTRAAVARVLGGVVFGDTADPDEAPEGGGEGGGNAVVLSNSLVDSRHTYLEMCQYRRFQFDTLRRAKHSSAMVLYHLLHPSALTLRVLCTHCRRPIRAGAIRWHCGSCHGKDVDLCEGCFQGGAHRQHRMTPYRVTFEASGDGAMGGQGRRHGGEQEQQGRAPEL